MHDAIAARGDHKEGGGKEARGNASRPQSVDFFPIILVFVGICDFQRRFVCSPQRGDLIVIATEFEFVKLIKEGHLPYEPCWDDYACPTGKHLVMRSPAAQITINQVDCPHKKPRWASFRDKFGVPNTEYLFSEWNEERRRESARKHVLLLHGYGQLRFSNLAVPHPTENKLIWWTDDLLKSPHEVDAGATDTKGEGPTDSPDAELVEEIVKTARDIG
jgi:hypothetical protein